MKLVLVFLLLVLVSCSRNHDSLAINGLSSRTLIAANGDDNYQFDIPGAVDRLSQEDKKRLYRYYPSTLTKIQNGQPLSLQDIKNLTRVGVSDDVIIYEIGITGSLFYLTADDETELEQAGVSFRVIEAMKNSGGTTY